jgi:hypothetical protein
MTCQNYSKVILDYVLTQISSIPKGTVSTKPTSLFLVDHSIAYLMHLMQHDLKVNCMQNISTEKVTSQAKKNKLSR